MKLHIINTILEVISGLNVCRAQETKHRKGVDKLTGEELRDIIKSVKEDYPDYKWR